MKTDDIYNTTFERNTIHPVMTKFTLDPELKKVALTTEKNNLPASENIDYLNFNSYEEIGKILSGKRLKILFAVRDYNPYSIHQLARGLRRDYRSVYRDVKLLAKNNLLELKEHGAKVRTIARAKYAEIIIKI